MIISTRLWLPQWKVILASAQSPTLSHVDHDGAGLDSESERVMKSPATREPAVYNEKDQQKNELMKEKFQYERKLGCLCSIQ